MNVLGDVFKLLTAAAAAHKGHPETIELVKEVAKDLVQAIKK